MNRRNTLLVGAAVALVLFLAMALGVRSTQPWQSEGTEADAEAANDLTNVVDTLFDGQVIAFEILGILLTAAMIGALVIARPLGQAPDEDHYAHPSPEQVRQSMDASAPKEANK